MPVYEIRFKPWEGTLRPAMRRILAIPKFTLMGVWSKWLAVALFTGGVVPLFGFISYLLILTNPFIREALEIRQFMEFQPWLLFERLLLMQAFFSLIVALIAAPRMISTEIANRALPLIYSRPISRFGYIGGKFMGLAALLSLTSWVQSLVLWIVMFFLYAPEHSFHQEFGSQSVPLLLSVLFIGLLIATSLALVALACSAATKSSRYGAVFLFALVFSTSFVTNFVQGVASRDFPNIGLREIFYHLSDKLLSPTASDTFSIPGLLAGIVIWWAASILFMLWKLSPVDVYGD